MEEKKVKFELSRLALIFVVLFGLCLLVWTFILGVWIGTKIGGKPQGEEIALEKGEKALPLPSYVVGNASNATNESKALEANETANATVLHTPEGGEAVKKEPEEQPAPTKKETPIKEASQKEKKRELPKAESKEKLTYQRKEVAQIAAKVKGEGTISTGLYALQIGAFSDKEKAEEIKRKAEKIGYFAQIKEGSKEGKPIYKVLVGKYENRAEAEQAISNLKAKLGVEKPFIVEMK